MSVRVARKSSRPSLHASALCAFRVQEVLPEHIDGDHGEGRDRLAGRRVGHAAGDAVLGLQHDRAGRSPPPTSSGT